MLNLIICHKQCTQEYSEYLFDRMSREKITMSLTMPYGDIETCRMLIEVIRGNILAVT